jgi:hypothetical protein
MRGNTRRCQAENPLIALSSFLEPALNIEARSWDGLQNVRFDYGLSANARQSPPAAKGVPEGVLRPRAVEDCTRNTTQMRSSANASLVPSIGTHPSRWPRHTVALEWTPNCFATQNTTQMRSSANAAAAPPAGAHPSRWPRHHGCSRMDAKFFATQNTTRMRSKFKPIVCDSQSPQAAQVHTCAGATIIKVPALRPLGGVTHPCEGHDVRLFRLAPLRPSLHHCAPLFQRIAPPIGRLGLVAYGMCQRGFAELG